MISTCVCKLPPLESDSYIFSGHDGVYHQEHGVKS